MIYIHEIYYSFRSLVFSQHRGGQTGDQCFGLVPEFKTGIHCGKVIVTSVGKQKREIVYHGDVLNTNSRIEGKCSELNQKLLISEDMLNHVNIENDLIVDKRDEIELRCKVHRAHYLSCKSSS